MNVRKVLPIALAAATLLPGTASATIPDALIPVLHSPVSMGDSLLTNCRDAAPGTYTIDGDISDWTGTPTGLGGQIAQSDGELIYTDYLFDAYGADNGKDAERETTIYSTQDAIPQTFRIESLHREDPPSQFGVVGTPENLKATDNVGDQGLADVADLVEVRLATTDEGLNLLARTTTMRDAADTALILLVDLPATDATITPGFNTALGEQDADAAYLIADGLVLDNNLQPVSGASAVANPDGWTNSIEARLPALPAGSRIALAAGPRQGNGVTHIANVAFRDEPARMYMDKTQALALHAHTLEPFFMSFTGSNADCDTKITPGYYERQFVSTDDISSEGGQDGIHQHYGLFVPSAYDQDVSVPLQFWLHWRGGKAHSAAVTSPRIMYDFGEDRGGVVVSPRGRGTSTWYLGEGHSDVLQVYDDVNALLTKIDTSRVYLSGHSMGGWGSWLFALLYPDRFAASLPVAGPATVGAWTGLDFDGCDDLKYDDYTPCYIDTNGSVPRALHTRRLFENLTNTPIGIFQGAIDELVPVSGVTRQVEELIRLGIPHRYYLFPTYEHFSHPVHDEWAEGVRYLDKFRSPDAPRHLIYTRDMLFERAVESGPNLVSGANPFDDGPVDFSFDSAWWMSGLTPADPAEGVARFEGTTFGIGERPTLTTPEIGGPVSLGQSGPYLMTGLARTTVPGSDYSPIRQTLVLNVSGATEVTIDAARAGLAGDFELIVKTDTPLTVHIPGQPDRTFQPQP